MAFDSAKAPFGAGIQPRPFYGKGKPAYGKGYAGGYGKPGFGKPYWAPTRGGGFAKQYPPGMVGIPYAVYPGYGLVQ